MFEFLGWSIVILVVLFFGSAILAGLWKAINSHKSDFRPHKDFEVYTEFDGALMPLVIREVFDHKGKKFIVVNVINAKDEINE